MHGIRATRKKKSLSNRESFFLILASWRLLPPNTLPYSINELTSHPLLKLFFARESTTSFLATIAASQWLNKAPMARLLASFGVAASLVCPSHRLHQYSVADPNVSIGGLDPLMNEYNQSIKHDRAFYKQDIAGSIAWAKANHKAGILSEVELQKIVAGLQEVEKEWEENTFQIKLEIDEVC